MRYVTHKGKELRAELPLAVEDPTRSALSAPKAPAEELPAPPPTVRETRRDDPAPQFPELEKVPATEDSRPAKSADGAEPRDARRPRWSPHR